MRIYGSSPLYSYVELMFRCKRMFIIAIVLGTVIASAMVLRKETTYNASMLVQMVGQHPDLVTTYVGSSEAAGDRVLRPAEQKKRSLDLLISSVPSFLEDVVDYAKLADKHPGKSKSDLAKDVRKHLAEPVFKDQTALSVQINWNDKQEANDILNALFKRFHEITVDQATATLTSLRRILKNQFDTADKTANDLAKKRIAYQSTHYNAIPTMLSAQIGRVEQSQSQLEDAKLDLADAEQRLRDINSQMQSVPKEIVESRNEKGIVEHPEIALSQEYDDLDKQYKQLLTVYSSQHPKVIDIQKRMTALKQQIEDAKQKFKKTPQAPVPTEFATTKIANPEYREMMQQKRELERTVSAQSRRVRDLQASLTKGRSSIQVMPTTEIEWQRIDSDYQTANIIRNNRKNSLEKVKLDLETDTEISGREVALQVPPAAEKAETGSKTVVLWALGPLLGIVVAFCFSLLVETMDHTLRTPVEVEKHLGKPVLAVIPKMAVAGDSRKRLAGSSKTSISS